MSEEEKTPLIKEVEGKPESDPGCTGGICNPKNCIHRYFPVLVIMCFLSFGKLSHFTEVLLGCFGANVGVFSLLFQLMKNFSFLT